MQVSTTSAQGASSESSSKDQHLHVDAESAPKRNIGNLETPPQPTTLSSVKDSTHTKYTSPSNQSLRSGLLQHHLVQLEECLKEKSGLPLQYRSGDEPYDKPVHEDSPATVYIKDSNKSAPSETFGSGSGGGGRSPMKDGGILLSQESPSVCGQQQIQVTDETQSGTMKYRCVNHMHFV